MVKEKTYLTLVIRFHAQTKGVLVAMFIGYIFSIESHFEKWRISHSLCLVRNPVDFEQPFIVVFCFLKSFYRQSLYDCLQFDEISLSVTQHFTFILGVFAC